MWPAHTLTPERIEAMCELARKGLPRRYIAAKLMIPSVTLYVWLGKGREILAGEWIAPEGGPDYAGLVLRLEAAEAEAVEASLGVIQTAPRGAPGRQWVLERTHRGEFGPRLEVSSTHAEERTVRVEFSFAAGIPEEQQLAALAERAGFGRGRRVIEAVGREDER